MFKNTVPGTLKAIQMKELLKHFGHFLYAQHPQVSLLKDTELISRHVILGG